MKNARPLTPQEEIELIKRAQSGDLLARNELVVSVFPIIRKKLQALYSELPCQDLSDILQDSTIELIMAIDRYDLDHPNRARLAAFMHKPILGVVRRFYRHSQLAVSDLALQNLPADSDPVVDLQKQEVGRLVAAALSTLPARRRQLLVTRFADYESTSQRQVGESWGCSKQNVQRQELTARAEFLAAWGDLAA